MARGRLHCNTGSAVDTVFWGFANPLHQPRKWILRSRSPKRYRDTTTHHHPQVMNFHSTCYTQHDRCVRLMHMRCNSIRGRETAAPHPLHSPARSVWNPRERYSRRSHSWRPHHHRAHPPHAFQLHTAEGTSNTTTLQHHSATDHAVDNHESDF